MVHIRNPDTTIGSAGVMTQLELICAWLSDHVGPRDKVLYSRSGQGWNAHWSMGENCIKVQFDDNRVTADAVAWFRLIWC